MPAAPLKSRCECQAVLTALADESLRVSSGLAIKGESLLAPANRVRLDGDQFQVGWLCPHCGRNTVRSFYRGALNFSSAS
jgi:hypothetical protein